MRIYMLTGANSPLTRLYIFIYIVLKPNKGFVKATVKKQLRYKPTVHSYIY